MFETIKMEAGKDSKRGSDVVKATGLENDLCSSLLTGYKQGKSAYIKARKKEVTVSEP